MEKIILYFKEKQRGRKKKNKKNVLTKAMLVCLSNKLINFVRRDENL
jgi:hypothetical protein